MIAVCRICGADCREDEHDNHRCEDCRRVFKETRAYYVCWIDDGHVCHAAVETPEQVRELVIQWAWEDADRNYEPSEWSWGRTPQPMSFLKSLRYIRYSVDGAGGIFRIQKIKFTGMAPAAFEFEVEDYDS